MNSLTALEHLETGDHLCLPVTSRSQQLRHTAAFTEGGLRTGYKVLVMSDDPGTLRAWLPATVPGAAGGLASGQIEVRGIADVYRTNGRLQPDTLLAAMIADIDLATAQGYAGLRLTGCTSSPVPATDALLDYESRANALFVDRPVTAMCQYHPQGLSPADWDQVSQRHLCTTTPDGRPGSWLRCRRTTDGVRLSGEVDLANCQALPRVLHAADTWPGRYHIDASQLRFADARSLGCLLRTAAHRSDPTTITCLPYLAGALRLLGAATVPGLRVTATSAYRV